MRLFGEASHVAMSPAGGFRWSPDLSTVRGKQRSSIGPLHLVGVKGLIAQLPIYSPNGMAASVHCIKPLLVDKMSG